MVRQRDLFMAFFRAGMLGYGGGLSAIPLMHREVVTRFEWMTEEEFADVLALANTLPGPVNTKIAGYVGWRLDRWRGMFNALLATILPTLVLMILLLTVLNAYKDLPWVQGMTKAVIPVAGVMIGVLAWDFLKLSKRLMGWLPAVILTIISLVVMEMLGIHPAILILVLIISALLSKEKKERRVDEN